MPPFAQSKTKEILVDNQHQPRQWAHGADLIVSQLEAQGVRQVFGIPGAKIDKVFDSLLDSSIRIIPVRHEANAAFMAAAVGRITGKAGVALVTSGPGCSNLITGMATANSEGDPVVALGGAVKRADKAKQVHQSMDTVAMFNPVTKYSVEVTARKRWRKWSPTPFAQPSRDAPAAPSSACRRTWSMGRSTPGFYLPAMRRRPAQRLTTPLSVSRR
jgi:acetolactate synthase-1/2/3 large subunit